MIDEKHINFPQKPKKQRMWCNKCEEPTTHEFIEEKKWSCLCCASAKGRTETELEKIKKTRKGWANKY